MNYAIEHAGRPERGLLAAASDFFDEDLTRVAVRVSNAPRSVGALALARGGGSIEVAPEAARLSPRQIEALFGHELAHIIQQREGRALPRRSIRGAPICDDAELEIEADALGRRFSRYLRAATPAERDRARPPPRRRRRAPPPDDVAQRIVTLGGQTLQSASAIPERAATILPFIEQGAAWLAWAIALANKRYDFPDEASLIANIQSGLHATDLVLLPRTGLLVSTSKLSAMGVADLKVLAANEGTSTSVSALQTKSVLTANDLQTQSDLAVATNFLGETLVSGSPVFQSMTLDDLIAVFNLVRASESPVTLNPTLQQEAAAFAVSLATSPLEFVDLYKMYYQAAAKANVLDADPTSRSSAATAAWSTLAPLTFGALECPQSDRLLPPEGVSRAVRSWVEAGNRLGFGRLTTAVFQIVANSRYTSQTGAEAEKVTSAYLNDAQVFFSTVPASEARVAQDGQSCTYPVASDSLEGRLQMSVEGQLTIVSFGPKQRPPASAPAPAPPAAPTSPTTQGSST